MSGAIALAAAHDAAGHHDAVIDALGAHVEQSWSGALGLLIRNRPALNARAERLA